MEKGDIYGLIGMILGIQAITDVVLYFVYSAPMFAAIFGPIMPILMPLFYVMVYGGGIAGLILSIIGISKNRSKFGYIGLITALLGIVIFSLVIFLLPTL